MNDVEREVAARLAERAARVRVRFEPERVEAAGDDAERRGTRWTMRADGGDLTSITPASLGVSVGARRGGRPRLVAAAVLVVAAIAAGVLALPADDGDGSRGLDAGVADSGPLPAPVEASTTVPTAPPTTVAPVAPPTTFDVAALVAPVDARGADESRRVRAMGTNVALAELDRCFAAAGVELPVALVAAFEAEAQRVPRHNLFPDQAQLRSNGFGVVSSGNSAFNQADPLELFVVGMDDDEANRFRGAYTNCMSTAYAAMPTVNEIGSTLRGAWQGELMAIEYDSSLEPIWVEWRACMADAGIVVADETAFFGQVDDAMRQALPAGDDGAFAEELRLAQIYADCIEPLERARVELRTERQAAFLTDHAAEVAAVEADIRAWIAQMT